MKTKDAEQLKLDALRQGIDLARKEFDAGREMPFDQAAIGRIKADGRAALAKRLDESNDREIEYLRARLIHAENGGFTSLRAEEILAETKESVKRKN